jgi:hypothetical protein
MFHNHIYVEQLARERLAETEAWLAQASAMPWHVGRGRKPAWRRLLIISVLILLVAGGYALWIL